MHYTPIEVSEYVARRNTFIAQMPANSVALIPANKEVTRSRDTEYLFCQDKDFYYLTGFNEPDALLVLINGEVKQSILFCLDKDPMQEVWHGRRVGPEKAESEYQFDLVYTLDELEQVLPVYINDKSVLMFAQGANKEFDNMVFACLEILRNGYKQGFKAPATVMDTRDILAEMRLFKSNGEINIMRVANDITANAHKRAMKRAAQGIFEYQLEADILHEFAYNGARSAAYGTIVGGGENATILHYTDNNEVLMGGEMVLIDAGAELAGYAADITRTFPVSGKFTRAQKKLYEVVLAAQEAAINTIKPGSTFAKATEVAITVLTQGLVELGILSGDLDQLIEEKACKKYFIHGLGHWLGLDVHDVGDYQMDDNKNQQRAFAPGMVMTIEPGLYFDAEADVPEEYQGVGVRIEDNILVTESGFENLSLNAPKTVAEIEALMA
ncbi:Xaa-Pro aminopeptidase [Thalassotalea aquiviva]|uniref:Xaa-Pro aminopeptidase n=1 Tax=Thalassotalea aquiviva TaxID=3242415 RepID=UPI00352B77A5